MAGFIVGGGVFYPAWYPATSDQHIVPEAFTFASSATTPDWGFWDTAVPWAAFVVQPHVVSPVFTDVITKAPTPDWGFWDTAVPWTPFVLQPRVVSPIFRAITTKAPTPDWGFWDTAVPWTAFASQPHGITPVFTVTTGYYRRGEPLLCLPGTSPTGDFDYFRQGEPPLAITPTVIVPAVLNFVPKTPTSDWGFWDTAVSWAAFVLQPRVFTPIVQQVVVNVVAQPLRPAYDFWPQTFDWVNVAAPRAPPPNGPAPYPNIAAHPATDENWYFWPGYETWYQIQPPPKSPFAVSGPAPYPNASPQPATDQNYRFWSNEYPTQPRTLFQPLPSSELPDFVPSLPTVWTFPETDPLWQQPTVRSPFAPSGPAPYPKTAPPPHRPDYDYWPVYDWSYVQPPVKSPFAVSGSAPYPNASPRSATDQNYRFWPEDYPQQSAVRSPFALSGSKPYPNAAPPAHRPDYDCWPTYDWAYVQPPTKSPFAKTGPAPYPNMAPVVAPRAYDWPLLDIQQPKFSAIVVGAAFVPSAKAVQYDYALDPATQHAPVQSPFAQSGPAPYPNYAARRATYPQWEPWPTYDWSYVQSSPKFTLAPVVAPSYTPKYVTRVYDYWPTYDWTGAQPPVKSPFAPAGPAPYPNMAPSLPTKPYDWSLPDIRQSRPQAVVVQTFVAFVPFARVAQYDYSLESPVAQQSSVRSPFAPTGPKPYPNIAPPARRPDYDYWPTYDWSYAQPPTKSPFASNGPAPYPNMAPSIPTRQYEWSTPDVQQSASHVAGATVAETFVPYARVAQYADYLTVVPQSAVVKSPFAPKGPAPYPNYAPRTATRQDFDEWPGYEAWYRIQPPPKSPFAPSGLAPYPNMAPPARRPDFDEWPVYDWAHVQPATKSPFAPSGPAKYPNYAAQRPTQPQWAPWPTYDWTYVQPPIKSPFAEAGPAPIGSWVASAQDKSDWHFWTAHLRYDWYCRSRAPGAAIIFAFIPGNAYSRYDVVPLAASRADLAGRSSSRVDRTRQASSQAMRTQQAVSAVDITHESSSRVDTD